MAILETDRSRLRGLWGFPPTPFRDDAVDVDLLEASAERQIAGGVDALCICGAIAQGDLLTPAERRDCLRAVADIADGRLPLVVALPEDDDAPGLAAEAMGAGAAALLVMPLDGDATAIGARLAEIRTAAPGTEIVLYHRPPLLLTPDDAHRLYSEGLVGGFKDGHRDVRLFRRLRSAVGHGALWVCSWEDGALPFWALGCDAFTPVSAAYAPEYSRAWFERLTANDVAGAARLLEAHAYPMVDLRTSRPNIEVSAVKAAMEISGLPAGDSRPPAEPLTPDEQAVVERLVTALHVALEANAAETEVRA
jgi:dihydrodipicolinate synthase/N-acetylneuraminate lyase